MKPARLIKVARGELPADLILANARVVNVFTGEIEPGNVAIWGGRVAGVGDYHQAQQVLDLAGKYIAPGFINGHTHLESSMLDIGQYARAVVPRGTLALVTDLHEIANVCGLEGIRYVLDSARRLPRSCRSYTNRGRLATVSLSTRTHAHTAGSSSDPSIVTSTPAYVSIRPPKMRPQSVSDPGAYRRSNNPVSNPICVNPCQTVSHPRYKNKTSARCHRWHAGARGAQMFD